MNLGHCAIVRNESRTLARMEFFRKLISTNKNASETARALRDASIPKPNPNSNFNPNFKLQNLFGVTK